MSEVWKHESTPNVLWGFIAVCLWEILVTISRLELLLEWIVGLSLLRIKTSLISISRLNFTTRY